MGAEGKGLSFRPSRRRSDLGEEDGFLGVAVADERRCKYFVGEGKAEGRGGETWGEFPVHSRRQARVSRVGGVDMPPRFRPEAETEGEGVPGG